MVHLIKMCATASLVVAKGTKSPMAHLSIFSVPTLLSTGRHQTAFSMRRDEATTNFSQLTSTRCRHPVVKHHVLTMSLNDNDGPRPIRHNPKHKRPLKAWLQDMSIRKECHRDQAVYFSYLDKIMNGIVITLSAVTSSAIFSSYAQSGYVGESAGPPLVSAIIAVLCTIFQSLQSALQFAELTEQHKNSCKQFTKLKFRLEIIAGDNFEEDDTLNMDRLTDWTTDYMDLLESSPLIRTSIYEKFSEKYLEQTEQISNAPLAIERKV